MTLAIGIAVLLAGCAGLREQAERVFLQQNRVSAALSDAILAAEMDDDLELARALYDREAELSRACAPLQRVGYQELFDETVDAGLEIEAFAALRPCRSACREVAGFLWHADPESASAFLAPDLPEWPSVASDKTTALDDGH